jgi:hypothetical protein
MILGDTHGDLLHMAWAINVAQDNDVDYIIQAGDFGYWEHARSGFEFLNMLNDKLNKAGLQIHWIDGNHENHTKLRSDYPPREDGMVEIRPNIIYIPRGTRWEWGGATFLGIGGAYSIDKHRRTEGVSWWPEEMITDDEVALCADGGPVDIVISHDVPFFVDLSPHLFALGVTRPWKWDGNSLTNRRQLTEVFDAVRPKKWYHGHYHLRYTDTVDSCQFTGLGANINQFGDPNWSRNQSAVILQLDEIQ